MKKVFQHITSITLKTGLFLALLLGGTGMLQGQVTQTFTTVGTTTWNVPTGVTQAEVLIVAGGGGGGSRRGGAGGGGAGGVIIQTVNLTQQSYQIVVGNGGNGGGTSSAQQGSNGQNSSAFGLTAIGGGGGGALNNSTTNINGRNGGSGGGGGLTSGTNGTPGTGVSGQGRNGGTGVFSSYTNSAGGGGGGAGGIGGNATNATTPGQGGQGITYSGNIYARGGIGGVSGSSSIFDGVSNTGNGGGGANGNGSPDRRGGNGGSGIVIITYTPAYKAEFISMDIGSPQWCAGETRTVSVTVKNVGQATWNTDYQTNIGLKWNTNGTSWMDYHVRTSAGNLAPGQTGTYEFTITAANNPGSGYTTPLAAGTNNLTFDVVNEGSCWFGDNHSSCGPGNSVFTSANLTINALPANPGNPTSNSPQCTDNGVTLNRSGTPPSGVTWFWQTSADGTSTANSGATYTVYESGTYYLRARNNTTQCWSSGAGSIAVTVNPLPTASITGNNGPVCAGSNALFTLTGTNGATVTYNINDGENTTVVLTGGTATVTIPGATANQTLNLVSVADANCSQALTSSSTVTVNPLPIFSFISTDITCFGAGNGTITISASGGSGLYEYSINTGANWQDGYLFEALVPGDFEIQVKDKNSGCIQTKCD